MQRNITNNHGAFQGLHETFWGSRVHLQ